MANIYSTDRNVNNLLPVAQQACRLLFQECAKQGIHIFLVEGYRSQERQNYLYSIGRTVEKNKNVVTWTKTSRHTSRLAWDVACSTVNGNTNIYNTTILKKVGKIAEKLNIVWGGCSAWVKAGCTDLPHFEVPSNWKMPKGYTLGTVTVPTKSTQKIVIGTQQKVVTTVADKETNKMANYIPKVSDMTSTTLKTSTLNMLKKAKAEGKITNDKWIKACEDGSLSMVDLVGLMIHIENK